MRCSVRSSLDAIVDHDHRHRGGPVVVLLGNQPSGTVTLSWDPETKKVNAKLQMVGFTPGSSHAMHIHQGSCESQGMSWSRFPT